MKEFTSRARVLSPGLAIDNAFVVSGPKTAAVEQRQKNVETELQKFGAQVDPIAGELSRLFLQISKEIDAREVECQLDDFFLDASQAQPLSAASH